MKGSHLRMGGGVRWTPKLDDQKLALARELLKEGFSLVDAAEWIGVMTNDLDAALWNGGAPRD